MTLEYTDGVATIRLARRTWLKLAAFLLCSLSAFARLECTRIDALSNKVSELHVRVKATEANVAEIRNDYRDLNAFLRQHSAGEENGKQK
jgi:hypothetical protein